MTTPPTSTATDAARDYRFLTRWRFEAPIERVWQVITDVERYPEWWPGVRRADVVKSSDRPSLGQITQFAVRGTLPYTLRFRSEVVEWSDPERLVVRSTGDLVGRGEWSLYPVDGGTDVTYLWEVRLNKPVLSLMAALPGARRAMERNHDRVMAEGYENLCRLLAAGR